MSPEGRRLATSGVTSGAATFDANQLHFRRPTEADHAAITAAADAWLGERRPRPLIPRRWLRDFGGTAWLVESSTGALIGFALAYHSSGRPTELVVERLAVAPSWRRRGVARALIEHADADARDAGATALVAIVWPGDPVAIRALRALGFAPDEGPATERLFGTPAYADYDGPGEDRAILVKRVGSA